MTKIYIVFGVSGCGKSTIGKLLAERLKIPFFDADNYHPQANIDKMSAGVPLTDVDRVPWLDSLHQVLVAQNQQQGAVLACSALKEDYRTQLAGALNVHWIHLKGSYQTILERIQQREHYMPESLLESQYDALEVPTYGITLDITKSPEVLVDSILQTTNKLDKADFGIYGLGVMGRSLALNMDTYGICLAVYNRTAPGEEALVDYVVEHAKNSVIAGSSPEHFISQLASPRKILLMIPAGHVVDQVIAQLTPLLEAGDVLIDGGNSHFKDTQRRLKDLDQHGVLYLGMGVSGGEKGALYGPSLMPGGTKKAYQLVRPYLEAIAAKDSLNKPCCAFIGEGGSGHYVKMIHNGIEYAEMQLIAEITTLLLSAGYSNSQCAMLFEQWNKGIEQSYLLSIMPDILLKKEKDCYLLDLILDAAGNKGTGAWSSINALESGIPASIMTAAVFARYTSAQKHLRTALASKATTNKIKTNTETLEADLLHAYSVSRKLNHIQGLELIATASKNMDWNVDLKSITRIWSAGCIIKSALLGQITETLTDNNLEMLQKLWFSEFTYQQNTFRSILELSFQQAIPTPCLSAAHQYGLAMTQERSSANIIQAQRDYFGAHTYKRTDKPEGDNFHTNWTNL